MVKQRAPATREPDDYRATSGSRVFVAALSGAFTSLSLATRSWH